MWLVDRVQCGRDARIWLAAQLSVTDLFGASRKAYLYFSCWERAAWKCKTLNFPNWETTEPFYENTQWKSTWLTKDTPVNTQAEPRRVQTVHFIAYFVTFVLNSKSRHAAPHHLRCWCIHQTGLLHDVIRHYKLWSEREMRLGLPTCSPVTLCPVGCKYVQFNPYEVQVLPPPPVSSGSRSWISPRCIHHRRGQCGAALRMRVQRPR